MVYPLYQQFICHFITNTIGFVFSVVAFSQAHQPNPLQRYNKKSTFARKSRESLLSSAILLQMGCIIRPYFRGGLVSKRHETGAIEVQQYRFLGAVHILSPYGNCVFFDHISEENVVYIKKKYYLCTANCITQIA